VNNQDNNLLAIKIKELRSIVQTKDIWAKKGKGTKGGCSNKTPMTITRCKHEMTEDERRAYREPQSFQ
jgi:hypothetical protein